MASKLDYDELVRKSYYFKKNPTYYEQIALYKLSGKPQSFYEFQVAFGWYILDFVIPSKLLIVELDGATHMYTNLKDAQRDKFCNECGLRVLRLDNSEAVNILSHIAKYPDMVDGVKKVRKAIAIAKKRRLDDEKAYIESWAYRSNTASFNHKRQVKKK